MKYRGRNEHVGAKILGFIILITIAGVMSGFAMFSMTGRLDSMKANEVLININSIAKEAYEASKRLDETNMSVTKMDIDEGCTLVKSSGAWYMVCNLNDITNGDKYEQEIVLKNFAKYKKQSGLIPESAPFLEEFASEKYIAMFIRFSSAKQDTPDDLTKKTEKFS